jgi:tetratricopeptide (TPR) repeat protein
MSDTSTPDLVQQGLTAARVGDIEDARRLFEKATRQMPYNVEAWLGLAGVVKSLEEKQKCFSKVLALDPGNSEAEAGLALVEQKLATQSVKNKETPPFPSAEDVTEVDTGVTFCYRHPQVETSLRCNRCNKPICPKCARRTPVGFRCPDCIREQENKYYSGGNLDYLIAAVITFPLSLIAAGLFTFLLSGLWFFWSIMISFFVAPAIAGFIAEAVRWGVGRRRSRYLGRIVAACLILATLPFLLFSLLGGGGGMIAPAIFLFLGTTTVLARLR